MSESAEERAKRLVPGCASCSYGALEALASCSCERIRDGIAAEIRAAESAARAEGMSEGIDRAFKVLAGACDNHTGENCVPFGEFMERYGNRCYFCSIDELSAANTKTYADGLREGHERALARCESLPEPPARITCQWDPEHFMSHLTGLEKRAYTQAWKDYSAAIRALEVEDGEG